MRRSLIFALLLVLLPVVAAAARPRHRPRTVRHVDLARYMGRWYDIAHLPTRFQKDCACCAEARYSLDGDGRVVVVNRCRRADGTWHESRAEGRVVSTSGARWKVTFFKLLGIGVGKGDYWILGLDPDYRWAVVGDPDRRYAWILCRRPRMPAAWRAAADSLLRERGYDPARLVDVPQPAGD